MTTPVRDTRAMIAGMSPKVQPGRWVFRSLTCAPSAADLASAIATFREPEGTSLILPAAAGDTGVMAWIMLEVHSALDGVGLTAAVSAALAAEGIACNVVAGFHHDHIFVPEADAARAVGVLDATAREARP